MELSEYLTFANGRTSPPRSDNGDYPVYGANGPIGNCDTPNLSGPAIVIGRVGSYCGNVQYVCGDFWATDNTIVATPLNSDEGYYWKGFLKNFDPRRLARGSGQPLVTQADLKQITVNPPPRSIRVALSQVLRSLDDKIAANNAAVESAEELVDTVIRKKISTAKSVTIADELVLHYGKSLPASKRVPGPIPVVGSGGISGWHSSFLVEEPTIVLGRKGTIGALHWIDGPSFPIDTVFWVESKRLPIRFIYSLLKLVDFSGANTDTAVPGLNRSVAYEMRLPFISDEAVAALLPEVSALDAICTQLRRETQILTKTRDELLPLLMSGKITVREAAAAGAHVPSEENEV